MMRKTSPTKLKEKKRSAMQVKGKREPVDISYREEERWI